MLGIFKKKKNIRERLEIAKARKYLERIHSTHSFLYGDKNFHYIKTSQRGNYKRYHFYNDVDTKIIYIVLSAKERNEIKRIFREKLGNEYSYLDTILSKSTGNVIQHRFHRPNSFNTSITFMTDDGDILEENLEIADDIFD